MPRRTDYDASVDEQVVDLRDRMRLLRTYY